jgi:hypothetical protein
VGRSNREWEGPRGSKHAEFGLNFLEEFAISRGGENTDPLTRLPSLAIVYRMTVPRRLPRGAT